MAKTETNIFKPLFDMFPNGEESDEIAKRFDEAYEHSAGENQKKINGLAVLLSCLDNYDDIGEEDYDKNSALNVSLLRYMQALGAAYLLGQESKGVAK